LSRDDIQATLVDILLSLIAGPTKYQRHGE
jgi:hypothetical protein